MLEINANREKELESVQVRLNSYLLDEAFRKLMDNLVHSLIVVVIVKDPRDTMDVIPDSGTERTRIDNFPTQSTLMRKITSKSKKEKFNMREEREVGLGGPFIGESSGCLETVIEKSSSTRIVTLHHVKSLCTPAKILKMSPEMKRGKTGRK